MFFDHVKNSAITKKYLIKIENFSWLYISNILYHAPKMFVLTFNECLRYLPLDILVFKFDTPKNLN